jgi:nucleotide-binding universal stress UspA family protein
MNSSKRKIKKIICAVRGIPESRATITHAIDLAVKHNAKLTFFLVIEAEFFGSATPTMSSLSTLYRQLEAMSQFAMLILVDRAERRGVEQVDFEIRKGNIPREIRKFALTSEAEVLVIGRPVSPARRAVFKAVKFDEFIAELEREAHLKIIPVTRPDSDR